MSLKYAILGLLSDDPKSGYELKRVMQSLPFMYWSASNNQIYNTLIELKKEGYVTNETRLQESLPAKKLYTITEEGLESLKTWTMTAPEQPEFKKSFLIQLAWSEQLSNSQLAALLDSYENELKARIALERKIIEDEEKIYNPSRSEREKTIWKSIFNNGVESFENELGWVYRLREELKNTDCSSHEFREKENKKEGEIEMFNYRATLGNGFVYVEILPDGRAVQKEQDALDLISLCAEKNTQKILIHDGALSDDFLRLQTGVAGAILQKFTNYNIQAAIVVDKNRLSNRFTELSYELNNGSSIGVFDNVDAAEKWMGVEK